MYAYAGNDPVNASDPSGLKKDDDPKSEFEGDKTGGGGTGGGGGGGGNSGISPGGTPYSENLIVTPLGSFITPASMAFRFAAAGGFGFTGGSGGGFGGGGNLKQQISEAFEQNKSDIKKSVCGGLASTLISGARTAINNNIKEGQEFKAAMEGIEGDSLSSKLATEIIIATYFKNRVVTKGDWDLKNLKQNLAPDGSIVDAWRDAGNFNYGATGTALSFSRFSLFVGAQGYSLYDTFGFEDQMSIINTGIAYKEIGCDK